MIFFALKYFMKYFWNISKISRCFFRLCWKDGCCWTTDNIDKNTPNKNKQIGRYTVLVVFNRFYYNARQKVHNWHFYISNQHKSTRRSVTASSTATTSSQAAGQSLQPSPAVDTSPQSTDVELLELLRCHRCRVVKRIPKGVRVHAADKLERLLSVVCEDPDNIVSWKNLLLFSFCCFASSQYQVSGEANVTH